MKNRHLSNSIILLTDHLPQPKFTISVSFIWSSSTRFDILGNFIFAKAPIFIIIIVYVV